jgi:hypothetical protein
MVAIVALFGLDDRSSLGVGDAVCPVDIDDELRKRDKRTVSQLSPQWFASNQRVGTPPGISDAGAQH